MNMADIQLGDYLIHDTDASRSGLVIGRDPVGPVRPPGPCVWLDADVSRPRWLRVGAADAEHYQRRIMEAVE